MSAAPVDVVLVEDSDEDAELALRGLRRQKLGSTVHRLADGAAALDFFFAADTTPTAKVILLDLKLPKVHGLEVLRRLKSDPRTQPIPVIILSSSKEDRDLAEAYALGANSYVVKPVDFDQFMSTLENLCAYWLTLNQLPS
jgi:CheY-like chemotaxis protein